MSAKPKKAASTPLLQDVRTVAGLVIWGVFAFGIGFSIASICKCYTPGEVQQGVGR